MTETADPVLIKRTVKIELQPDHLQAQQLATAQAEYTRCLAWWLAHVQADETTSRTRLHRAHYAAACRAFPTLARAGVQQAMSQAGAAQKSYLMLKQAQANAQPPRFDRVVPLQLRNDQLQLAPDPDDPHGDALRLALFSRPALPLFVPCQVSWFAGAWLERAERPTGGWIHQDKKGRWWLAQVLEIAAPAPYDPPPEGWLGVDLGLRWAVALSDPRGRVNELWGADHAWRRERRAHRRQVLGKKRRKWKLRKERRKGRRWQRDVNRKLARQIVDLARARGWGVALEELSGIRQRARARGKRGRRRLHGWPYYGLQQAIQHAAQVVGVPVVFVDPRYTSQTCSRCGARGRRPRRGLFCCPACGLQLNADLNGARNIARRAGEGRLTE